MLKNLKDLLPYLVLVAIYFFFVNLEARKVNNKIPEEKYEIKEKKSKIHSEQVRITIPVIPYKH
tara:strand:+ start:252 stop:443 length:192 start_codon:yes stop_codon:yes gene_type:complete